MELEIKFTESAFRHGVSQKDIKWALRTRVYDAPLLGFYNKYVAIGFDTYGNPLEIMYNEIDEDAILVFHAMKCRKSFIEKLNFER